MTTMILTGRTLKGKNVVRNHGTRWEMMEESDSVQFSDEEGPWFLLRSEETGALRWVKHLFDKDFMARTEMEEFSVNCMSPEEIQADIDEAWKMIKDRIGVEL